MTQVFVLYLCYVFRTLSNYLMSSFFFFFFFSFFFTHTHTQRGGGVGVAKFPFFQFYVRASMSH